MDDLFAGTWVLITGASSGLGEEFARQLAARRANLILTARSGDKLAQLATALAAAHGIETEVIAEDLGAPGGADKLCAEVDRRGRDLRHLVSNAGFGINGAFSETPPGRDAEMVRLNCEALVTLSRHFLPHMVARRAGGIIHVASIAGFQPVPYMATYGASKAFVLDFSLAVAEEVRATGVRVLALCPGPVATGFQAVAGSGIAPSQRAAVLSATDTVRLGLRAYERKKDLYIPGRINRMQQLASSLAPRRLLLKAVGRMMKAKQRH